MSRDYKRIATEEAFMTPLVRDLYSKGMEQGAFSDQGFVRMWGTIFTNSNPFIEGLMDVGPLRLSEMDAAIRHRWDPVVDVQVP